MDVLYYWKNVKEDREAGNIGWFQSKHEKLGELRDSAPDWIWLVKTPEGRKGEITLLGKVKYSDKMLRKPKTLDASSTIFYDPDSPHSIWFDALNEETITQLSQWMKKHFPRAVAANFQGDNGLQAMRGEMLKELQTIASPLTSTPFSASLANTLT